MAPDGPAQLTPRQRRAVLEVAAGASVAEAALAARVGERTIKRWRARPEFRALVETELERIVADQRGAERRLRESAVARLRDRLADTTAPDGARDRIALAVFRDAGNAAFGMGGSTHTSCRAVFSSPNICSSK